MIGEIKMQSLIKRMEIFAGLQLEKLIKVAFKHGGIASVESVTSELYQWNDVRDLHSIREHLREEIKEWEACPLNTKQEEIELMDIANCAMLVCMKHRALRGL